ncbi:testis-expressed basic protein 1 isoform X5 [Canis lupus familiaris]|uniref:testis-expressed basic protein 1 isoform X5 n=1 Tax=Canis lupus familiaris TaxID=9615 RepID=UPI0018F2BC05|nr:testis-expressed basic protein 1 isoform X5 [Canis lupus familiaris]
MAVLEITLAVILTLLGLAILAILLTRWTRRKQNEIDVSRYSSEQSAGLLDYEDGRGFRHLYSTESDASYDDQEGSKGDYTPSTNSLALSRSSIGEQRALLQGSIGDAKTFKATPEPLSGTAGPITGTIGPIMQFTAPIPGATGPIKLSQKTIVQTPGPIVQYTGISAETSEMTRSTPQTNTGSVPPALTGPPLSMPRGVPLPPIMISQRTSTRPEKSKIKQEEPAHVAVPIITPVPIVIGPVAAVDSSGKITISPMVIFPGCMDAELAKKSDFKAQILKNGATTKSESSQEENKKTLKKEILVIDSDESLTSRHKTESKWKTKGIELKNGRIGMEIIEKESETRILREEDQVKMSDMGIPKGEETQVKRRESRIPQGQESQVENNEAGISEGQESQVESNEAGIPEGQDYQVENNEDGIPQEQEYQVEKSGSEILQVQESQVKEENSEDQIKQDKGKEDARKKKDTEENDAMKKRDVEKYKVKRRKESEVKSKKKEGSLRSKDK